MSYIVPKEYDLVVEMYDNGKYKFLTRIKETENFTDGHHECFETLKEAVNLIQDQRDVDGSKIYFASIPFTTFLERKGFIRTSENESSISFERNDLKGIRIEYRKWKDDLVIYGTNSNQKMNLPLYGVNTVIDFEDFIEKYKS